MIDLDPALAAHLKVALASHIRALKRDGIEPPPQLAALVDSLQRDAERDAAGRKRRLAAMRSRRYRARRRGESSESDDSAACRLSA
jgi:hypothetical protein